MADATSLTPPSSGLSATPFPNKGVEFYSPKGPENVKITLYRCTCTGRLLEPPHGTTTAVVSSKYSEKILGFIESVHERQWQMRPLTPPSTGFQVWIEGGERPNITVKYSVTEIAFLWFTSS